MAGNKVVEKVALLVAEPLKSIGLELWEVRYVKEGASWYLRVYIDKQEGINIDDCVNATHLLNPIIDENNAAPNADYFEVCSPGLERELTTKEHLSWANGKKVRAVLIRPIDNKKEIIGQLIGADENITISAEGEEITLSPKEIAKIKLFELE